MFSYDLCNVSKKFLVDLSHHEVQKEEISTVHNNLLF